MSFSAVLEASNKLVLIFIAISNFWEITDVAMKTTQFLKILLLYDIAECINLTLFISEARIISTVFRWHCIYYEVFQLQSSLLLMTDHK